VASKHVLGRKLKPPPPSLYGKEDGKLKHAELKQGREFLEQRERQAKEKALVALRHHYPPDHVVHNVVAAGHWGVVKKFALQRSHPNLQLFSTRGDRNAPGAIY
jgi:hypothetical protein